MDRAGENPQRPHSLERARCSLILAGEQGEENLRFTQQNVDMGQLEEAIGHWLNPGHGQGARVGARKMRNCRILRA